MIISYRLAPSVRSARVGEDLVLLDLERGTYFTLNATGAFVCERLDGARAFEELAAAVVIEFEVELAVARLDLRRLLDELVAEGLVVPAASPIGGA